MDRKIHGNDRKDINKRDKYEAVLTCGLCGLKQELSDKEVEDICQGNKALESASPCGHISYASSIRVKCFVRSQDWRMGYGSTGKIPD